MTSAKLADYYRDRMSHKKKKTCDVYCKEELFIVCFFLTELPEVVSLLQF